MGKLVQIMALGTIAFGALSFFAATSAMHQTTAAVFWTGGWLMMAAGTALERAGRPFEVVPAARSQDEAKAPQ